MGWKLWTSILIIIVLIILFFTDHAASVRAAIILCLTMLIIKILYDVNKRQKK